jgi:serine/threonine protein kinase
MEELRNRYDILRVMGHGGFSSVYKARSKLDPDQIYALKQLDLSVEGENAKEYQDFKDEVEILKKLDHPNIVRVYNEYVLDHKPSLEMEFLDGETLEAILKREKYFSIDEVLDVIDQISSALHYCHHYPVPGELSEHSASVILKKNAIIHNDINTKNIIRTKNEDGSYRYVLIDFGLSFTDPQAVGLSKKEDGMAEYKAPEKWRGETVDTPSDIYSFGIVLYELLTGRVPFPVKDYKQAAVMLELEEKHKSAPVPELCPLRINAVREREGVEMDHCDIPDWLGMLVLKCLAKDPADRFRTGGELSRFYFDGLDGRIKRDESEIVSAEINIDPAIAPKHGINEAFLEVIPNILTEAQHFFIVRDRTTVGRRNDAPGSFRPDIAIKTSDQFISKNHCQIIRRQKPGGGYQYSLQDAIPSKNGTFYNTDNKIDRISPDSEILLKEGDYFWIGNTRIVFHGT